MCQNTHKQANQFITSKFSELDKHIDNPNLENSYNNQKAEFKYSHTPAKQMENNQVFGFSADARRVNNSGIEKEVNNQISNQEINLKDQGIDNLRNDNSKIDYNVKGGIEHELNKGITRRLSENIGITGFETIKDLATPIAKGGISVTEQMGEGIVQSSGTMAKLNEGQNNKEDKK